MVHCQVTTEAGDNFDRTIESLKGKHHDVVNMVLFQPETTGLQRNGDFRNVQQDEAALQEHSAKPTSLQLTCSAHI